MMNPYGMMNMTREEEYDCTHVHPVDLTGYRHLRDKGVEYTETENLASHTHPVRIMINVMSGEILCMDGRMCLDNCPYKIFGMGMGRLK